MNKKPIAKDVPQYQYDIAVTARADAENRANKLAAELATMRETLTRYVQTIRTEAEEDLGLAKTAALGLLLNHETKVSERDYVVSTAAYSHALFRVANVLDDKYLLKCNSSTQPTAS